MHYPHRYKKSDFMCLLRGIALGGCWLVLLACEAPKPPGLLHENSTTRLVEVAPALSPEERALMNKIANRTLLQEVVDKASQEQVQTASFACSPQSGGLVAYVRNEQKIRGLRLSLSQEKAGRSTRWYYQNKNTLALVAHEQSQWQGDQEYIEQTVFYVDDNTLLQILHRVVQAVPSRLEKVLEQTPFEQVTPASQRILWTQLQMEEQQLSSVKEQPDYTNYFCF